MSHDSVQPPDLAQRAGIGLRFGRVIGRPPGHLVVHQDFDVVLAGQLLYFQRVMIRGGQRLLEDHVYLARGAGLNDFQMAVVLYERPDDVRLGFVQHLLVVVEERNLGEALMGFGDQVGNGLGDAGQFRVFSVQHRLEVAPDMGVHHADDGDLVVLGLERESHE